MIAQLLKQDIETYAAKLRTSGRLFTETRRGRLNPEAIAVYVANLRLLIQQTHVNLCLARDRSLALGRPKLAAFFDQRAGEEKGHDVWADCDILELERLFSVRSSVRPSAAILGLLKCLREKISEEPVQYIAYMIFAEYLTVLLGSEWICLLEEYCGIPATAMSVVGNHVELDRHHVDQNLDEIGSLVDDERYLSPLRQTLQTSISYFEQFCDEVCSSVEERVESSAVA